MAKVKYPIGLQNFEKLRNEGYAKPFAMDKRKLFKVGVNFSKEKRCIDDYKIVG